jgi:hypothetical protein
MTHSRPPRGDVALAAAFVVVVWAQLLFAPSRQGPLWANLVCGVAMCAPVAWRRVAPLGALIVCAVSATIFASGLSHPQDLFSMFLLLSTLAFSAGAYLQRTRARVALAVIVVLIVGIDLITGDLAFGDQIFPLGLFCGWWALGRATAVRRRQHADLRARAEQLER